MVCAACSASGPGAQLPAPAGSSAPLLEQIRALVGNAACTTSSQCHTLALGSRPCGGPQSYLAWSSATTDGAALRLLAQRYHDEQQARDAAAGLQSDCRMISDPGAECRAGTCQLRAAAPAGPGPRDPA